MLSFVIVWWKMSFVHALENILDAAFVSIFLFWEIIFKAERKVNMWSSFSLEMRRTLLRVATEKKFKISQQMMSLIYCKLEKVIWVAHSSLLVILVSLSSAPFFSFPFFRSRKQCWKLYYHSYHPAQCSSVHSNIQIFRKSARIS